MTQSQNDPASGAPLAEPEGVNAESADGTAESKGDGAGSGAGVQAGGHPEDAPDPGEALTGYSSPASDGEDSDDDELVGAPGNALSESGQDGGSME